MILESTHQKAWIEQKINSLGKVDSKLMEKTIMALTLLEQLRLQGLDFIFKGGTSLVLLLDEPKRFSTDIDIILPEKISTISTVFDSIIANSPFTKWVEDNERKGSSQVPVEHYKFYYPGITGSFFGDEPMLLDILYEKPLHKKFESMPIQHSWLQTSDPHTTVRIPSVESILGDKLTAFAPNTTGILYTKKRPVEIIKQLYDIGILFNSSEDFKLAYETFAIIAQSEIEYRKLSISISDVLDDIFNTSVLISNRDEKDEYFQILSSGIKNIFNFIFSEKFRIESAIVVASKAAYISRVFKNGAPFRIEKYKSADEIKDWIIENQKFNHFNRFKKDHLRSFFLLVSYCKSN